MTLNEKTYNDYYDEMLTKTDNRKAIKEAKRVRKIADNLLNSYNADLWDIIISIADSQYYAVNEKQTGIEPVYLCLVKAKAAIYAIETVVLSPYAEMEDASEEEAEKIRKLCRYLSENDTIKKMAEKIVKAAKDPVFWSGPSLFSVYLMFKAEELSLCFMKDVCLEYSIFADAEARCGNDDEKRGKAKKVTDAAQNLIFALADTESELFLLHVKKASEALIKAVSEAGDAINNDLKNLCLYWVQLSMPVSECRQITNSLMDSFYCD